MEQKTPLVSIRAFGALLVLAAALSFPALWLLHSLSPATAVAAARLLAGAIHGSLVAAGAGGLLLLVIYPPSWPLVRRFFARQRARMRLDRLAMAELVERVKRFPNAPDMLKLGRMLEAVGRHVEALHPLTVALQLDQAHLPARFSLGTVLLAIGRHTEAAAQLSVVAAREPEHAYHQVQLRLAEALIRAGRPEFATSPLAQFERETGGSPESSYWKGRCLLATGSRAEARAAFAASIAMAKALGRRSSTEDRIAAARSRWFLWTRVR